MAYILAILWGLVQGLTEILPVSGSAHMAILERVLGQTAARTEQRFFYGLLDLALAAAVLIAYRQELAAIIRAFSQKPTRAADRSVRQAGRERRRLVLLLAVGLLPLLLEILLQRWTAALYTKPLVWAAFLALGGLVLFLSTARTGGEKDARQMRLPDALLIGAAQAVSVLPGLSRTGLTVAAGLYRGAKAEFSLEYSFLLAVPFWLGAGIIRIIQGCVAGVTAVRLPAYLAGAIVCVLAARFALARLRQLTRKKSWSHFAFYSWAAAVFSIFLFLIT